MQIRQRQRKGNRGILYRKKVLSCHLIDIDTKIQLIIDIK